MKLTITITLKQEILDPQGQAIKSALNSLGFDKIYSVRQGKVLSLMLDETDRETAVMRGEEMCKKLLVNEVIEDFSICVD